MRHHVVRAARERRLELSALQWRENEVCKGACTACAWSVAGEKMELSGGWEGVLQRWRGSV